MRTKGVLAAAQLPFFGDMMGIIGALGFTPMDFVLPQFLWIAAYKPTGFKCARAATSLSWSAAWEVLSNSQRTCDGHHPQRICMLYVPQQCYSRSYGAASVDSWHGASSAQHAHQQMRCALGGEDEQQGSSSSKAVEEAVRQTVVDASDVHMGSYVCGHPCARR